MDIKKLNNEQKNLKSKNKALFSSIKKDFNSKGKPLSKAETNKILNKIGFVGTTDPNLIFEISNIKGYTKIKINETEKDSKTNTKKSSKKEKISKEEIKNSTKDKLDSNTLLYSKYKKIISTLETNLKKKKVDFLSQDEIFSFLKKLKVTLDEDEVDDFLSLLSSRSIINIQEETPDIEEVEFEDDEEFDKMESLRNMSDTELDNDLGEAKDHIK